MNRYCFQLLVAPAGIADYTSRHEAVWPDMLRALEASGWHNYSLFLRPDGLLIGYFESEATFTEAQDAMAQTDVNSRWQAEMGRFFVDTTSAPGSGLVQLSEVFHLEDQLDALPTETEGAPS